MAINALSARMVQAGQSVFRLGLGQSPFPVPHCVVEALRENAHQKAYLDVQGLRELREAVARFHERSDSIPVDPDLVLVGPGSKELMFLLQLAYYGDLVVPTPCWVSYAPQARVVGRAVRFVPTNRETRWHFTAAQLDELCAEDPTRPRLLVLNYPGNPDGLTYATEELERVAEVARRYHVVVLSDEIYGKLHHDGAHVSIARFYPEGTIVSSGLSKWCGAGGWRLGTFAFPPALRDLLRAMTSLASETFTSTSAPIQYAAIRAFSGGHGIERYLAHARRVLAALGRWCVARLRAAGALLADPEGAFYLFPDFGPLAARLAERGIRGSAQLARAALAETGVAFLPGVDFGRPPDELTARLAYVDFDGAEALLASEQRAWADPLDEDFLQRHCYRTVRAVGLLCDWLEASHP
jgi:aspartate aminotransferase